MIFSILSKMISAYLNLLKEIFELMFGIKLFRMFMFVARQFIKLVKYTLISFNIVIILYYFMYPQHVYQQLIFHKNEANNYFSYFLENSATQQICYQWKIHKSALIEKEESLQLLEQKVKKEEDLLENYINSRLKQLNEDKKSNRVKQENDDVSLNVLQHQNNIKKYQNEYEEYKSKVVSFNEQKRKEMMWQSWIEMDLICNLNSNQQDEYAQPKNRYLETDSIILELQILNLAQPSSNLKQIPLNILLIDRFNQKIPLKQNIILQSDSSTKRSYAERVLRAILTRCFYIIGINIEDDVFEIREEVKTISRGSGIGSDISGILISLENQNNQYIIQQARIEIIPSFRGLKYFIFHYFYATFVCLFFTILMYLYIFAGIVSCLKNNNKKTKKE